MNRALPVRRKSAGCFFCRATSLSTDFCAVCRAVATNTRQGCLPPAKWRAVNRQAALRPAMIAAHESSPSAPRVGSPMSAAGRFDGPPTRADTPACSRQCFRATASAATPNPRLGPATIPPPQNRPAPKPAADVPNPPARNAPSGHLHTSSAKSVPIAGKS